MAIQMRRGNEVDFDSTKMLPGEWAVSLDQKIIRMCFSPGVCVRMATYEAFEADMETVRQILANCETAQEAVERIKSEIGQTAVEVENNAQIAQNAATTATQAAGQAGQSATNASQSAQTATEKATEATEAATLSTTNAQTSTTKAQEAETSAQNASQSAQTAAQKATEIVGQAERAETAAIEAESYAKGGTGSRVGEDTDNALYYKEQAATEAAKAAESAKTAAAVANIDVMTVDQAGIGKPDGTTIVADEFGTLKVSDDFLPNGTVSFEKAAARANISPSDTVKGIFGKLMKWLADLKPHAFSSPANNLLTTVAGSALDAVQGKRLNDDIALITASNTICNFELNETNTNISEILSSAGMLHELTFQENMNLLKKINTKPFVDEIIIHCNANTSKFNEGLPVNSGGFLTVVHPKQNRRFFKFYDYRKGIVYSNYDFEGMIGQWWRTATETYVTNSIIELRRIYKIKTYSALSDLGLTFDSITDLSTILKTMPYLSRLEIAIDLAYHQMCFNKKIIPVNNTGLLEVIAVGRGRVTYTTDHGDLYILGLSNYQMDSSLYPKWKKYTNAEV